MFNNVPCCTCNRYRKAYYNPSICSYCFYILGKKELMSVPANYLVKCRFCLKKAITCTPIYHGKDKGEVQVTPEYQMSWLYWTYDWLYDPRGEASSYQFTCHNCLGKKVVMPEKKFVEKDTKKFVLRWKNTDGDDYEKNFDTFQAMEAEANAIANDIKHHPEYLKYIKGYRFGVEREFNLVETRNYSLSPKE